MTKKPKEHKWSESFQRAVRENAEWERQKKTLDRKRDAIFGMAVAQPGTQMSLFERVARFVTEYDSVLRRFANTLEAEASAQKTGMRKIELQRHAGNIDLMVMELRNADDLANFFAAAPHAELEAAVASAGGLMYNELDKLKAAAAELTSIAQVANKGAGLVRW